MTSEVVEATKKVDVIVLCGGYATRMGPQYASTPKALLPLSNIPLLSYTSKSLDLEGVERIIISTNERFESQFRNWIEQERKSGFAKRLELVADPTNNNETKLGAVRGMAYAKEKAKVERDLLVVLGDNYFDYFDFDLMGALREMQRHNGPSIIAYDIGALDEAKRLGVVEVSRDGTIASFEEKPQNPKSTLISTGISFYPKQWLGAIDDYTKSSQNPDNIGNLIKYLSQRTKVHVIIKRGLWVDIGTPEAYKNLQELLEGEKRD